MTVFTRAWWEAAGARVTDTALAALAPLAFLLVAGDVAPTALLSLVAVQALAAFATALAGLPEITDRTVPLWRAIVARVARTLGQSLATVLVGVELLEQIVWSDAWILVAGATLYTLLRTFRAWLPETVDDVRVAALDDRGVAIITSLGAAERDDLASLAGALEPGDPTRGVLERILSSRVTPT